ncbi:hypothetical protein I8H83_01720 [Candidatus Saccharibacteria bacterium]|nr:hypothetical protein [Candidatus Saccharibacteria bacterium]
MPNTESESENQENSPVSLHTILFDTPLYDVISLNNLDWRGDDDTVGEYFSGRVDAYSAKNHIDTTYEIKSWSVDTHYSLGFDGFCKVKLTCVRKPDDILYFFIASNDDVLWKVGQWPSLADLSFGEIGKKYAKQMDRADMQEFKKAIGLAAHGVGAGSFVYLRRIFEKLIDETYQSAKKGLEISDADFLKSRMDEKVMTLSQHLPSQLVGMKKIYSILSDGVHNLSEEECLAIFPALKLSIELILDQKIETDTKKHRDKLAQKQIQAIEQSLRRK